MPLFKSPTPRFDIQPRKDRGIFREYVWKGIFIYLFFFYSAPEKLTVVWNQTVFVAHSCLPLCNPMDYSPPGSSVLGILQARILEWVAMPSSRGSSRPRDETPLSCVSSTVWQVFLLFLLFFNHWCPLGIPGLGSTYPQIRLIFITTWRSEKKNNTSLSKMIAQFERKREPSRCHQSPEVLHGFMNVEIFVRLLPPLATGQIRFACELMASVR